MDETTMVSNGRQAGGNVDRAVAEGDANVMITLGTNGMRRVRSIRTGCVGVLSD